MLTSTQLSELRNVDITAIDKDDLVDALTVSVDQDAPIEQRIQAFLDQIKNPYAFRVGDIAVKLAFNPGGRKLEDAVASYLKSLMI